MIQSLKTIKEILKRLHFVTKISGLSLVIVVFGFSCQSNQKGNVSEYDLAIISNFMMKQEEAWNKGDLDGFMNHYWKSDSLRFIGKSGLNLGWQKTLDNYKKSYQTKQEMGTLKFTNKSLDIVGEQTIFVVGEWELSRADSLGDLGGMYSLIWEKKSGVWVITTDHSS